MPPNDLIQHFNGLLAQQQELLPRLPKAYFYWQEGQYFARFGNQDFGNQFLPILGPDKSVIGHESRLWVRTALGNHIPVDEVFQALSDLDEVVFLDRVTRTMQALNFSLLSKNQSDLLSLSIQPRHILGVTSGHGRIFDTILSDCGLAAANVLLHTIIPAHEHYAHFRRALFSYSAFSYRVGIHINTERDWDLYCDWGISADYLIVHTDVDAPTITGAKIIRPTKEGYEIINSNIQALDQLI